MEQRDYLMRQIEQAGRVLGKVLADLSGLKREGKVREGIGQAGQTLQGELDLRIEELTGIPVDQLVNTLLEKKHMFQENLEKLADLLVEIADGYELLDNQENARSLYQRALTLYEYVDQAGSAFSFNRHSKIQQLKHRLDPI